MCFEYEWQLANSYIMHLFKHIYVTFLSKKVLCTNFKPRNMWLFIVHDNDVSYLVACHRNFRETGGKRSENVEKNMSINISTWVMWIDSDQRRLFSNNEANDDDDSHDPTVLRDRNDILCLLNASIWSCNWRFFTDLLIDQINVQLTECLLTYFFAWLLLRLFPPSSLYCHRTSWAYFR